MAHKSPLPSPWLHKVLTIKREREKEFNSQDERPPSPDLKILLCDDSPLFLMVRKSFRRETVRKKRNICWNDIQGPCGWLSNAIIAGLLHHWVSPIYGKCGLTVSCFDIAPTLKWLLTLGPTHPHSAAKRSMDCSGNQYCHIKRAGVFGCGSGTEAGTVRQLYSTLAPTDRSKQQIDCELNIYELSLLALVDFYPDWLWHLQPLEPFVFIFSQRGKQAVDAPGTCSHPLAFEQMVFFPIIGWNGISVAPLMWRLP